MIPIVDSPTGYFELSDLLFAQYATDGSREQLDDAITAGREGLKRFSNSANPFEESSALLALGTMLLERSMPQTVVRRVSLVDELIEDDEGSEDVSDDTSEGHFGDDVDNADTLLATEAVEDLRRAAQLGASDPLLANATHERLWSALNVLYILTSDAAHLENLIQSRLNHLSTLAVTPSNPRHISLTESLGGTYKALFDATFRQDALNNAITCFRNTLKLEDSNPSPIPNLLTPSLKYFSDCLLESFEQFGDENHLNEAIEVYQRIANMSEGSVTYTDALSDLCGAYIQRYECTGNDGDLERAKSCMEEGRRRSSRHEPSARFLVSSSSVISALYDKEPKEALLSELISIGSEILALYPEGDPFRLGPLTSQMQALRKRFNRLGQPQDLALLRGYSVELQDLLPNEHPERSNVLLDIGKTDILVYDDCGDLASLIHAVDCFREALSLMARTKPIYADCVAELAGALLRRFDRLEGIEDLEDAIKLDIDRLELVSHTIHRPPALLDLGEDLLSRFAYYGFSRGHDDDLKQSISYLEEAYEILSPADSRSADCNKTLADALHDRFIMLNDRSDLDRAVRLLEDALMLQPHGSFKRLGILCDYGRALFARYRVDARNEDLSKAIAAHEEATAEPATLNKVDVLRGLAQCLSSRYSSSANPDDLARAMQCWEQATGWQGAATSDRFLSAVDWATVARNHHHPSAMHAYDTAISLLSQLAFTGLNVRSRHRLLSMHHDAASVAVDAAMFAIETRSLEKAIEFLEHGRSIFWQQALRARSPELSRLHERDVRLATRLEEVALLLERGSFRDIRRTSDDNPTKISAAELEATKFRELGEEWESLLTKAREYKEFDRFLLPKPYAELTVAARRGPVVILCGKGSVNYALIMREPSSEVEVLSLSFSHGYDCAEVRVELSPTFIAHEKQALAQKLKSVLVQHRRQSRETRKSDRKRPSEASKGDDIFRDILGALWRSVVSPVLQVLNIEVRDYSHANLGDGNADLVEIATSPTLMVVSNGPFRVPSTTRCRGLYSK